MGPPRSGKSNQTWTLLNLAWVSASWPYLKRIWTLRVRATSFKRWPPFSKSTLKLCCTRISIRLIPCRLATRHRSNTLKRPPLACTFRTTGKRTWATTRTFPRHHPESCLFRLNHRLLFRSIPFVFVYEGLDSVHFNVHFIMYSCLKLALSLVLVFL